jgi:hypothetical protein
LIEQSPLDRTRENIDRETSNKPLSSEKKRRKKQGFKIEKNKQILKKKDPRFNGKIN